jgi:hypothetical protein
VVNAIVLADDTDPIDFGAVLGPEGASIGWAFDGETWTPPEQPSVAPGPAALAPLTARQLRLGLLQIGIKPADVAAAISALPEDQRDVAEIEWDYASEYRRDHPLIAALGASFGLTVEQIDDAWRDAMAL